MFSGLELCLAGGQAVQLTGANGSGKTTLLRTLSGLQQPQKGQVLWRGADIHAGEGYAGAMLYLAHENALNPDLTARENLRLLAALHDVHGANSGGAGKPLAHRVDEALRCLGVDAVGDRPCRRLSAGQRRRAALARLLLSPASLWLLDEPAAALDTAGREVLGRLLAEHVGGGGAAIYSTHEPLDLPSVRSRNLHL